MDQIPKKGYCLITKSGCRYCDALEDLLFEKNISYIKINILSFSDEEIKLLKNDYNFKTYPLLILDKYALGGYHDMLKYWRLV